VVGRKRKVKLGGVGGLREGGGVDERLIVGGGGGVRGVVGGWWGRGNRRDSRGVKLGVGGDYVV